LFLAAAKSAQTYKQDVILEALIYKELGYTYALLKDWAQAEEYSDRALEVLPEADDPEAFVSFYAQTLDVLSDVHREKGQSLASQGRNVQALSKYEAAYELAQKVITILEGFLGESDDLIFAHIGAGEHLLAMHGLPRGSVPEPLNEACEHWRTALDMARRLGIANLEREAQQRLKQHCESS
jgi:tetratricopeptide (TPR) repeat protein